jgi:hypothetical protein
MATESATSFQQPSTRECAVYQNLVNSMSLFPTNCQGVTGGARYSSKHSIEQGTKKILLFDWDQGNDFTWFGERAAWENRRQQIP